MLLATLTSWSFPANALLINEIGFSGIWIENQGSSDPAIAEIETALLHRPFTDVLTFPAMAPARVIPPDRFVWEFEKGSITVVDNCTSCPVALDSIEMSITGLLPLSDSVFIDKISWQFRDYDGELVPYAGFPDKTPNAQVLQDPGIDPSLEFLSLRNSATGGTGGLLGRIDRVYEVPEPDAMSLLCLGLIGLFFRKLLMRDAA